MSRNPYIRPMSKTTWYLRNSRYRIYALREVTCLLVGFYAFLIIFALRALWQGETEWNAFLAGQQGAGMVIFHGIALLYFFIYQTVGWFQLAPKAMPLMIGEKKVAPSAIVIGHYLVWVLLSGFVLWFVGVI